MKRYFVPQQVGNIDSNYKTAKEIGWKWLFEPEQPVNLSGDIFEAPEKTDWPVAREIRDCHCRGIIFADGECRGEYHCFLTPEEDVRYWQEFRAADMAEKKNDQKQEVNNV